MQCNIRGPETLDIRHTDGIVSDPRRKVRFTQQNQLDKLQKSGHPKQQAAMMQSKHPSLRNPLLEHRLNTSGVIDVACCAVRLTAQFDGRCRH